MQKISKRALLLEGHFSFTGGATVRAGGAIALPVIQLKKAMMKCIGSVLYVNC
jgi:hypothetical protein